jgi:hypothetical protein
VSSTLALAAAIASLDRDALVRLATARRILSPQSVQDSLGLAIELLRTDSIARALTALHRDSLNALLEFSHGQDVAEAYLQEFVGLALAGLDSQHGAPVALTEVTEVLDRLTVDFDARVTPPIAGHTPTIPVDTSTWYGPALTSVRRTAEILREVARRPVRLSRREKPVSVAVRNLAERVHGEPDEVERLLDILRLAGLLAISPEHGGAAHLEVTRFAQSWLAQGYTQRWISLAVVAAAQIDDRLRAGLDRAGFHLGEVAARLSEEYPLLPEAEHAALISVVESAHDLGLTVKGQLTPAALALIRGETEAAQKLAHAELPPPVTGVYLQPDLSLIVPGPLSPEDESLLSVMTDTEQLGPAASLRVSTVSLARAVRSGVSPETIRATLHRLSLTGIPQPLDYLIDDLSRKTDGQAHAAPVPAPAPASAPAPDTTFPPDPQWAPETPPTPGLSEELQLMIDRVLASSEDSGDNGAMIRRIELAIRDRVVLRVTVVAGAGPQADERIFTLMPVSLRSGRMRATDQLAGVERTIPLSAITTVEAN